MAVFVSVLAVAVAIGCFVAILLSDTKRKENDSDDV
jgi:hypothetical protein